MIGDAFNSGYYGLLFYGLSQNYEEIVEVYISRMTLEKRSKS